MVRLRALARTISSWCSLVDWLGRLAHSVLLALSYQMTRSIILVLSCQMTRSDRYGTPSHSDFLMEAKR